MNRLCYIVVFLYCSMMIIVAGHGYNHSVNWVLEDDTPNNGWDYSQIWQKDKDKIVKEGKYKNIKVNTKMFFKGKTSLYLVFQHHRNFYSGCSIYTRSDNTGKPPLSSKDANRGKDISKCDILEFWIKTKGLNKYKNLKIELMDTKGKLTGTLFLNDYNLPNQKWQLVQIPLDEFSWHTGVNKKQIKAIRFSLEPGDSSGRYVFYLDNIRFIKKGIRTFKRFKLVFNDNTPLDKAWNFSGAVEGKGTKIDVSSYYKNLPLTFKNKFKGLTALQCSVHQKRFGWGFIWFTGSKNGQGVPPKDWDDYNTPKDISKYNTLQFWIKGNGRCYGKIEMTDTVGKNTGKIPLIKTAEIPDEWTKIVIPYKMINWEYFDTKKFKDMKIIMDSDHPPGDFELYIDNLEFIKLPEE